MCTKLNKICPICNNLIYGKRKSKKYCSISCRNKNDYLKNKEKRKRYQKERRKNQEILKRIKEYDKIRHQRDKEKRNLKTKRWREANKEKKQKIDKEYYENNKEKYRNYSKKMYRQKYNKNQKYTITYRIRRRLQTELKNYIKKGITNKDNIHHINYKKIIEHLKPFPKNLSEYHIDHIRPLCTFDLTNPKEVKKAFAPENHQWLTAEQNMKKGGKWEKIYLDY